MIKYTLTLYLNFLYNSLKYKSNGIDNAEMKVKVILDYIHTTMNEIKKDIFLSN